MSKPLGKIDLNYLENIFVQNYKKLCYVAYKIINNKNVAEDIVQDVFVKLWVDRLNFSEVKNLDAFLYISVKNKSISYLRGLKEHSDIDSVNKEIMVSEESVTDYISTAEMLNTISRCISSLPSQCSRVMSLLFAGYNCEEIAQKLSLASSSVRAHKARGIKLLIKKLPFDMYTFKI